jgi:hypothetical protein
MPIVEKTRALEPKGEGIGFSRGCAVASSPRRETALNISASPIVRELGELREYCCPSCARQLETEAVPPGYPIVHEFLPDIGGFYRGWLGRPAP